MSGYGEDGLVFDVAHDDRGSDAPVAEIQHDDPHAGQFFGDRPAQRSVSAAALGALVED